MAPNGALRFLASLLLGGLLADTAGIRAVYYLGGALLVATALAGSLLISSARSGVDELTRR
jgi:hypothetical protein